MTEPSSSTPKFPYRVAADIGGTFTDIAIIAEGGVIATRKVLSTPADYSLAVVDGIAQLLGDIGLPMGSLDEVLHGTTVATNAILERRGARTALITTRGMRDVLELRRIRMPNLYDPLYERPEPLVPREHRLEVEERVGGNGEIVTPLNVDDVMRAVTRIRRDGVESVAVTFLHAYLNDAHERQVGEILRRELPGCFITTSVEILPEIREYERTSTTVINAYLGPPVKSYLRSLLTRFDDAGMKGRLLVMQSSGGMLDARTVTEKPAQIVECGPAAGVIGAAHLGRQTGLDDLITLDMGGTTAKASLIENGRLVRTDEYEVGGGISLSSRLVKGGGYALRIPVIDISEVGAGGGSIVWFDRVGQMKVGPRSAGANPGPVCYGTGGTEPTVTDANVVLGYLNPTAIAGGTVPIDAAAATASIEDRIARPLGRDLLEMAYGVHVIANANMMRAVKAVSTYRGRDPREFVMLAFGGSGGIHAVELARSLGMGRVVVPAAAGVFSALGLLCSDIELALSSAFLGVIGEIRPGAMEEVFRSLEAEILGHLGYRRDAVVLKRFADLRYTGQAYELTVPLPDGDLTPEVITGLAEAFETEHERTYGHRFPGRKTIQTISLRLIGTVIPEGRPAVDFEATLERAGGTVDESRRMAFFGTAVGEVETPVLTNRAALAGTPRQGPLVMEEYEGTIVVPPGARASLDRWANVVIDIESAK